MTEGDSLRIARVRARISQLDLSLAADIHPTRYWKIENDYVEPTAAERAAIACALGVSESEVWQSNGTELIDPKKRGSVGERA